jgi:amino acid adenylation domain-containing protein
MLTEIDSFLSFDSLADAFRSIASRQGDATLLSYEGAQWSYHEIDAWSDAIADRIALWLAPRPQVVGVMSNELPLVLAAYLGVLKAGCAYAALDPALPNERLSALARAGGIAGCVVDPSLTERATAVMKSSANVLVLAAAEASARAHRFEAAIERTARSHVLFTSGSTGAPKAVPRTHEAMLHNAQRHRLLGLGRGDRVSLLSRRGFFDSVSNPFAAILAGATVCARRLLSGDAGDLARWIARERVTVYYSFPTIFRQMLATGPSADMLSSLRLVYLGGESVHPDDLKRCRELLRPDAQIAVGLGSTETGLTAVKLARVDAIDGDVVTVGKPLAGIRIEIWDEGGKPAEPMQTGTIVCRSRFIFHGYLNDDGESRRSIYPDPGEPGSYVYESGDRGYFDSSGELVVIGRGDHQVKLRGFRVELGEIESTLRRHAQVREAAAIVASATDGAGDDALVAFVRPELDKLDADALKAWLAEKLPEHMVPVRIVVLARLPQTPNGKLDRHALAGVYRSMREQEIAARREEEPQGPLEATVASLWSELLHVPSIGRQDRFFALGGNSIKALIFVSRLSHELGAQMPLTLLLEDDRLSFFCARCSAYLAEPSQ